MLLAIRTCDKSDVGEEPVARNKLIDKPGVWFQ
jgi:hypothetical protein